MPVTFFTTAFFTSSNTCGAYAPYSISTLMFTRTDASGVTSTLTPLRESLTPITSCTRLSQPPFIPMTPGTSCIAIATIFSITPLLNVSESSPSKSSSAAASACSCAASWLASTLATMVSGSSPASGASPAAESSPAVATSAAESSIVS